MDTKAATSETSLKGLAISAGAVFARVFILDDRLRDEVPVYRVTGDAIAAEQERLRTALSETARQIGELVDQVGERLGSSQASIFVAQRLMVEDPGLVELVMEAIAEGNNAEAALDKTLDAYESRLREIDNEYISERASDVGEVRRRVLALLGESTVSMRESSLRELFDSTEPRIIVARELTPGETFGLSAENTVGFITEHGGRASHAAILARAMGIPAVSGIPGVQRMLNHGQEVLLNGDAGEVILWPSAETLRVCLPARRKTAPREMHVPPVEGLQVYANISQVSDVEEAVRQGVEGIGLYRTEFEFFVEGRLLTEDEQYERYRQVTESMGGKPVYIRLLDFGADKAASFLDLPKEENPCLGCRGARLLQHKPELFQSQARALARASQHGPIWVMYPMIIDLTQFLILRAMFQQHAEEVGYGDLKHGVMFEVPSACIEAKQLLQIADFGSIGSNDLIQYLFAVDRNNELVAQDYNADRPALWVLLGQLAQAAKETGKPLSLCGEMGGQVQYVGRLMRLGITTVSVSPRIVGLARVAARKELGL